MRGVFERAAIAALGLAVVCGPAHAAANDCWSAQETSAAKIRDLQSMLMVAALRCHGSGVNVLASYNGFVNANRGELILANNSIKAHFSRISGSVEGQRRYDRFATALANNYGSGGAGSGDCAAMADLAYDAQRAGSASELVALADERGLRPDLPTMQCPMTMASK